MPTRDELIEVGARALFDEGEEGPSVEAEERREGCRTLAEEVIDAVEDLIRADEQDEMLLRGWAPVEEHETLFAASVAAQLVRVICDQEQERKRFARWKYEATEVMREWERVWEALGSPGRLGESKAAAALALLDGRSDD